MAAPCVAIVGYDMRFFDKLPVLFLHTDANRGSSIANRTTWPWVWRCQRLQTAYLILAARSLGWTPGR